MIDALFLNISSIEVLEENKQPLKGWFHPGVTEVRSSNVRLPMALERGKFLTALVNVAKNSP